MSVYYSYFCVVSFQGLLSRKEFVRFHQKLSDLANFGEFLANIGEFLTNIGEFRTIFGEFLTNIREVVTNFGEFLQILMNSVNFAKN